MQTKQWAKCTVKGYAPENVRLPYPWCTKERDRGLGLFRKQHLIFAPLRSVNLVARCWISTENGLKEECGVLASESQLYLENCSLGEMGSVEGDQYPGLEFQYPLPTVIPILP